VEAFAARGCSVAVVSQSQPAELARYRPAQRWKVRVLADPQRRLYQALGLERTRPWIFLWPPVVLGYLWSLLRGYRPRLPRPGEDVLQLGGDFLLNRRRTLLYAYRSAHPTDRPSAATLLAVLDVLRQAKPEPLPQPKPPDDC